MSDMVLGGIVTGLAATVFVTVVSVIVADIGPALATWWRNRQR